jgi:hypothetical protein
MRLKPEIKITITANGKTFTIGACHLIGGQYLIKRGRVRSDKIPTATLSQVFAEARKFAVRNAPK